jgi:hypothetical protein
MGIRPPHTPTAQGIDIMGETHRLLARHLCQQQLQTRHLRAVGLQLLTQGAGLVGEGEGGKGGRWGRWRMKAGVRYL